MTDNKLSSTGNDGAVAPVLLTKTQQQVAASLARRHRQEKLFKGLGLGAVLISLTLVAI